MGIINILDAQTANMIAAGEVVERPSSAAKELLENSIDAGATAITLEIKNGGKSLIRVTDNGCGFLRDDIPKALLRHATSKIACGNDINGIRSLGFRGEALAAISSVSRMEIITKSPKEEMGTRLTSDENGIVMEDSGCPDGTTVIMRDIYYNTPARQKFLKKDGTESASCISAAERLALSHPEISFTVICDGERRFKTEGEGKLFPAIYSVFGRDFAKSLVEADYSLLGVSVKGFITKPDAVRGSRAMQTAFVNGRFVKSKTVQAAVEEAFRSYIPRGKFPAFVIFVTLNPELTDVNVHPAKTEIKFASEKDVFRAVYYAVKNALEAEPTEKPLGDIKQTVNVSAGTRVFEQKAQTAQSKAVFEEAVRLFSKNSEEIKPSAPSHKPEREISFFPNDKLETPTEQKQEKRETFRADIGEEDLGASCGEMIFSDSEPAPQSAPASEPESAQSLPEQITLAPETPYWRMIGQAYDAYIFVETEENILVIDKHAAHERIIYERLAASKELHVQELLAGIPVSVGREQAAILLENSEYLEEKGFKLEDFGEGTIIVRTVPSTLSSVKGLNSILEDFAKGLSDGNGLSFAERCDRALYTVACKAALKAGIKNRPEDDENVVKMLSENPSLQYCPHGRPFIKKIPKREIEKFFDR
ncbi:MAG: DNA mismatch repair endonuclease MutL [Clostridia bacterium]|nr:DNA mismatch repair endonuclease MutL [Clostridia bacterium]